MTMEKLLLVERALIIGKTAPEWSKKKRELTVCTVGITPTFEWRRFYPVFASDLDRIHNFCWVDVKVSTKRLPDPRPETRRVLRTSDCIIEVGKIADQSVRKWYVEKCAQPCVEELKRQHKTIGIVKPIVREVKIAPIEARSEKATQLPLTLWVTNPYVSRLVAQEKWKVDYAKKPFEVKFKFTCGSRCEHEHRMKVLDLELFMLYRNLYGRYHDQDTVFEKMRQEIEKQHREKDVYLGLGTHLSYPFVGFMIGSVIRLDKGPATRPLGGE